MTTLEELNGAAVEALQRAKRATMEASKAWEAVMVLEERIAKEAPEDSSARLSAWSLVGTSQRKAKACWEMATKEPWEARHEP